MSRHAPPEHWNREFRERLEAGDRLDWGSRWTDPFLPILRDRAPRRILDLGCGLGNEVLQLRLRGFPAIGADISVEALAQARTTVRGAPLLAVDLSRRMPFPDACIDAVTANVALHMFDDATTRALFAEIGRIVAPRGVALLHVNAREDRPLRARHHPPERELAPDFVLEKDGQTMHFFSEAYLRELLEDWAEVETTLVVIPHRDTGEPFKAVWRVVARRS